MVEVNKRRRVVTAQRNPINRPTKLEFYNNIETVKVEDDLHKSIEFDKNFIEELKIAPLTTKNSIQHHKIEIYNPYSLQCSNINLDKKNKKKPINKDIILAAHNSPSETSSRLNNNNSGMNSSGIPSRNITSGHRKLKSMY